MNAEVEELATLLRTMPLGMDAVDTIKDNDTLNRAATLLESIPTLKAELEREQIRLAACGVVAMADTPESATMTLDIHPDYHSASLDDVIRMVDSLMECRAAQSEEKSAYTRYKLYLPDGDLRSAKVRWVEHIGDTVELCLSVTETPGPISVNDRLPEPEDCDESYCWFYNEPDFTWEYLPMGHMNFECPDSGFTHWRPCWAIPIPTQEG
jgi:hypothetical protein